MCVSKSYVTKKRGCRNALETSKTKIVKELANFEKLTRTFKGIAHRCHVQVVRRCMRDLFSADLRHDMCHPLPLVPIARAHGNCAKPTGPVRKNKSHDKSLDTAKEKLEEFMIAFHKLVKSLD